MKIEVEKLEEMRAKALEQTEEVAKSVGDNHYKETHPPKDPEKGIPVTKPRQIQTQPLKVGRTTSVYFDAKTFLEGDQHKEPYLDPDKIYKQGRGGSNTVLIKKNGEADAPKKAPFFPIVNKWCIYNEKDLSGSQVRRFGSPYDHVEATEKIQIRQIKDAEGKVITKSKEITSVPVRFGKFNSTYGHTINKFPAYEPETDTGRDKKIKEERDKWNELYKHKRGRYFKSNCYPRTVINPDKDVYHIDGEQTKEPAKVIRKHGEEGEKKPIFKPNNPGKHGILDSIGPFHRLIPNPLPRKIRVKGEEGAPKKPVFK